MEMRAHAMLDAAWAAGIRYFDAARSYGRAEEFLGRWLAARRIPPDAVTVGSKWG
jgi:aryl-alcohol dehydrogenase-like predicted oxidoreductase